MDKKIKYILPVVMGVVLIGWIVLSNKGNKSSQSFSIQTPAVIQKNIDTNMPTIGDINAPVTMVEYGHFKCPFCNRFFRETKPQITEKYIKTGKVKFVWKDFPYEGGDSEKASEAAHCAQDQGRFWEYHDLLFTYIWKNYYSKNINGEESSVFTDAKLKEFSSQLGLDMIRFNGCLDSGKYIKLVRDNYNEGIAQGVKSTPTFLINGQKIVGAQPFSVFEQIIDSKLP